MATAGFGAVFILSSACAVVGLVVALAMRWVAPELDRPNAPGIYTRVATYHDDVQAQLGL